MDIFNYLMNKKGKNLFYNKKSLSYLLGKNAPHYLSGSEIEIPDGKNVKIQELKMTKESTQSNLPSGYTQVEYIETTGTQYINTELSAVNNLKIETKIEVTSTEQNTPVFGLSSNFSADTTYGSYFHLTPYLDKWYYGTNGTEGNGGSYNPVEGTIYNIVFNGDNNDVIINGTTITSDRTFGGVTNTKLTISRRGTTSNNRYGKYKYYYFKIYNKSTNNLILDLIPCYRNSDNEIGMYDTVNNEFYTNDGTGIFISGSTLTPSPSPSNPVEINTVKGYRNLLEITDSNLLVRCSYVSGANTNEYKLLCTASDMYVNEVGSTGTSYSKSRHGNLISCSYGETIYYDLGNELFNKNFFTEFDEDLVALGSYNKQSSSSSYTPTNASCKYVTLRFGYGANAVPGTTYTLAPIIVKGNTVLPYVPYGTNWVYATISDGTNSKNIPIPLNNNEIVGKSTNLDELIIDKNGHCWINKKFIKIDSYNGETITTDYWSTTGGLDIGATIYYVADTPTLIDLNYNVDLTLYEGINNITNSENMDMYLIYHY